jgi:hypothetical protein
MAAPPASTKASLQQRLSAHARGRWPQLRGIAVRFRATFAYVTAHLPDGDTTPNATSLWRIGFPLGLRRLPGDHQDSVLHTGYRAGSPEDALDTACGLYLGDPTAWL